MATSASEVAQRVWLYPVLIPPLSFSDEIRVSLTDTQLGILAALCRPLADGNRFATPATNQEIADEVFLSVDAVKAHLRTLYRKFGIEDLPHNQKRARLAELVVEGGYLGAGADDSGPEAPPRARAGATAEAPVRRRHLLLIAAGALGLVAVIAAVLALTGVFSGDGSGSAPSPAAYRADVRGYCALALSGAPGGGAGGDRAERARDYLEVIETMRGRLESLTPPAGSDVSLERFRAGLGTAADFTSEVAEGPPPGREEARIVAQLTFAAGQVQAGALGYGLGHDCLAIGDLVARSAQNAAAAP